MIKIIFFVLFFVSSLCSFAYAYSENDISRLEFQKYGRCYEDDSLAERLSRLENDYLGMTQSGDIEKRVYNLIALENPNTYESYENFSEEKAPNKPKGKIKTIWNNISSGFNNVGGMTGFIPPITTYGNYYNGYSPSGYHNHLYNGFNPNNHLNSYNSYPNSYYNSSLNNNYLHHRGCIHQPNHYFNPINNRLINGINRNFHNNHYYNGVTYPTSSPYQNPYLQMQGATDYQTCSTVTILSD